MQLFNGKTSGRGGKDGVITSNTPEDAFSLAKRVEKPGDKLCRARAGVNDHD